MPTVFIAFGITGDLMRQKILPGLFALHTKGELPENFEIIGVSRKDWNDAALRDYVAGVVGTEQPFLDRLRFVQGDVAEVGLFERLSETVGERSTVLYFSLSPALYTSAFEKLTQSLLARASTQLMIEKPFGTDDNSAEELNQILHSAFAEEQIYRVDHYLAKESLQHVPHLSPEDTKKVAVSFFEKSGVEKRGESYDAVGALRDVGQNHVLEMFAAATSPHDRIQALRDLQVLTPEETSAKTTRAQYEGYSTIPGVAPGSQTETYFKVETSWQDIPIIFEGGKHMAEDFRGLVLTHKDGSTECFEIEQNKMRSEYEKLIFDCLHSDHTLFVGEEEIALLWRFIDPIIENWSSGMPPLTNYVPFAKK